MKNITENISDLDQRRAAASELDQNWLVLAGAGTGKTTLLIDRLVLLILGKQIPVEGIVALTFTKKAAEEMRVRLEDRLRAILENPQSMPLLNDLYAHQKESWPALIQKTLDDIPKAQIGTIHSFAAALLRLYPIQAGVDPNFREDEGEVFDRMFEDEWHHWLREELGEKAKRPDQWKALLARIPIEDLHAVAKTIASPLVQLDTLKKSIDYRPHSKQSLDELTSLQTSLPVPDRAKSFLKGLESLRLVLESLSKGLKVDPSHLASLRASSVDKPPKGWSGAAQDLKELKAKAMALAEVDDDTFQQAISLLTPLVLRFRREFNRVGGMSFDGLLVLARNLVRDHPDVRREIKARFETFLVDEFQDTDPLQGEILFYLSENPGQCEKEWRKVKLEPGRLFVVGDPKQSIYRFRGADMAAFQEFQTLILNQGASQATLSTNFRSQPGLLHAVNALFSSSMTEEKFVQPPYVPLHPFHDQKEEASVEWFHFMPRDGEKRKAPEYREAEAESIAQWISRHVGGSFRYCDCALLFRSANAFDEYVDAFKKAGIPYLAEGEKFFYQTTEVTEFLNLLSAVANPEDSVALVGVLRSPLGGCTDQELLELSKRQGLTYRRNPPLYRSKIGGLYKVLQNLHAASLTEDLPSFIQRLFDQTWVLEWLSLSRYGEQAVANVMKIKWLAQKWSENNPMSLEPFIKRFKTYREDEKEEGENPLADVRVDAVKLMTIHKAKGLEFPVVFLPNLSAQKSWHLKQPLLLRDWQTNSVGLRFPKAKLTNSLMPILQEKAKHRDEAEELRVFYVASTRAQNKLMFCLRDNTSPKTTPKSTFEKAALWPAQGAGQVPLEKAYWPVREHRVFEKTESVEEPFSESKPALDFDWKELLSTFTLRKEEWEHHKQFRRLSSPTWEMKKSTEFVDELDKAEFKEPEQRRWESNAVQVGVFCHKVLELWDFESPLENSLAKAAAWLGWVSEDPAAMANLKESKHILDTFCKGSLIKKIKKGQIIGKEIPFIYGLEAKASDGMRGSMDLLYELENELIIADYKTNKIKNKSIHELEKHYSPQAHIYKTAIEKTLGRKAKFQLLFLREDRGVLS